MSLKQSENSRAKEADGADLGMAEAETALTVLAANPAMSEASQAISSAMANGRAMQNAVSQVQNAHSIFHAQTTNGVKSLLQQKSLLKKKKARLRYFTELKDKAH